MGFDDLAKHMASRDGKKTNVGSVDELVADMASADRRMARQRDVILGAMMLVGGAIILALYVVYLLHATETSSPDRPSSPYFVYSYALPVVAIGAIIVGTRKLIRGIRGR